MEEDDVVMSSSSSSGRRLILCKPSTAHDVAPTSHPGDSNKAHFRGLEYLSLLSSPGVGTGESNGSSGNRSHGSNCNSIRRAISDEELSRRSIRWWDHALPLPFKGQQQKHNLEASSSFPSASKEDSHCLTVVVDVDDRTTRRLKDKQHPQRHNPSSAIKNSNERIDDEFISDQLLNQCKLSQVLTTEPSSHSHRRGSSATNYGVSEQTKMLLRKLQQDELHSQAAEVFLSEQKIYGYNAYRDDYFLGDVIKSASHMITESTPERAIRAVESLQMHDFAWVKRSNGNFTYAILAYRASNPTLQEGTTSKHHNDEDFMYFVVNDTGATKMFPKSRWHDSIRLIHNKSLPLSGG